uniref:SAM domain-containing protein n=1 Tax=Cajanus cajan TaxID=3821 RepID=A0A151SPT7_CAJCA|nr:hypothetical protein KK1_003025 [Cajanus cajan]
MDWFSWLSKTGLEPSLVYEYGLTLAHNELEEEDMFYFNHEFLQSMGISIAKHRLEILKLARKEEKETLFLTNGSPTAQLGFSSPVVYHFQKEEKKMDGDDNDDDDGYWTAAVEEIKWDTMFQDLKPN